MSRRQLERSGYLKSFPHFLGCVCCLSGIDGVYARTAAFEDVVTRLATLISRPAKPKSAARSRVSNRARNGPMRSRPPTSS